MKLVNFLLIGAMKCGTSFLAKNLSDHDEISFSSIKEPHYFSKYQISLKQYHELFDFKKPLRGEASTTYTFFPSFNVNIVQDIYRYNPNMKLLYIVRNPLDRLVSDYMHLYSRKYTSLSIDEAIKNIPDLINRTKYFSHIERYLQYFNSDQFFLITYEELTQRPLTTMNKIAKFLNISPFENIDTEIRNNSLHSKKLNYKIDLLAKSKVSVLKHLIPLTLRKKVKSQLFKGRSLHSRPVPNSNSLKYIETELKTEMEYLYKVYNIKYY